MVEVGLSTKRSFCAFGQPKFLFVVFLWDVSMTLLSICGDSVLLSKSCVSGSNAAPWESSWVIYKTLWGVVGKACQSDTAAALISTKPYIRLFKSLFLHPFSERYCSSRKSFSRPTQNKPFPVSQCFSVSVLMPQAITCSLFKCMLWSQTSTACLKPA